MYIAPSAGAPEYLKHMLMDLMGDPDSNTILMEDFNTLLWSMADDRQTSIKK